MSVGTWIVKNVDELDRFGFGEENAPLGVSLKDLVGRNRTGYALTTRTERPKRGVHHDKARTLFSTRRPIPNAA